MEDSSMATPEMITRREAILRVTALLGGATLVGGTALLTGCRAENTDAPFTPEEIAFLDEVAETILPQTGTPGAKAAKTGAFMALIVTDSYNKDDRKIFRQGMRKLDKATRKAHDVPFMEATTQQRISVLEVLDREQKVQGDALRETHRKRAEALLTEEMAPGADANRAAAATTDPPAHYFRMMKELALLGYFTSEIGCTQAQRYIETPGRFDPCVPYVPGDKAWAQHA
jgi:hypothetical protein